MSTTCAACSFLVQHPVMVHDKTIPCPGCSLPMTLIGTNGTKPAQSIPVLGDPLIAAHQGPNLADFRKHWRELHEYAIIHRDKWDADKARAWFKDWQTRIPSAGCSCAAHWRSLVKDNPPRFDSADEFFLWSWEAHDAVSERLGNQRYTLDEARALYSGISAGCE